MFINYYFKPAHPEPDSFNLCCKTVQFRSPVTLKVKFMLVCFFLECQLLNLFLTLNSIKPPIFVTEQAEILAILNWFITQLDKQGFETRQRAPVLHIKKSNSLFKSLYRFDENADFIWSCIKHLAEKEEIFKLQLARNHYAQDVIYDRSRLIFNPEKEELIRQWLHRPRINPEISHWNELVRKHQNFFEAPDFLLNTPLQKDGWSAEQIMGGLICIGQNLKKPLSLRQLSCECFLSDSKFLDSHSNLIAQLFPSLYPNIITRPLIINAYLPQTIHSILFIENQDTFLEYCTTSPEDQAVIYSYGFKASCKHIRQRNNVVFSIINSQDEPAMLDQLQQYWYRESPSEPAYYFWGDLDYSGLAILKALREPFPHLIAWQKGYQPMLERLAAGQGHLAEQTRKCRQAIVEQTGCHYTDKILLPALKEYQRFVDQEIYRAGFC